MRARSHFAATSGAIELMSTTSAPFCAPSMTPFSPSTTAFTCGEFGSMVMMIFAFEATSLGEVPTSAPACLHLFHGCLTDVVDDEAVSCLEQILAHGFAHDSQTNKSNFAHLAVSFCFSGNEHPTTGRPDCFKLS